MSESRASVASPAEALQHIETVIVPAFKRCATLTWSTELKKVALTEIEYTLSEMRTARSVCKANGKGAEATEWRKIEEVLNTMVLELRMWLALAEGRSHEAWDIFVDAQMSAEWALRWLPGYGSAASLLEHLNEVERVVFPRQVFVSAGLISKSGTCSICKGAYGTCNHLSGEVYDGEVASRKFNGIDSVREVSFVDEPASKHCRALNFGGRDTLTGEQAEV